MSTSITGPSALHRLRIQSVETLSDGWYVLKKTTFDFLRRDGTWQRQSREIYDRGNGAVILLYNLERRSVVLTRQFRYPAFVNGHHGMMIEAPAGLLDMATPEDRIKAEVEEETGYRIEHARRIFEAFTWPTRFHRSCARSRMQQRNALNISRSVCTFGGSRFLRPC